MNHDPQNWQRIGELVEHIFITGVGLYFTFFGQEMMERRISKGLTTPEAGRRNAKIIRWVSVVLVISGSFLIVSDLARWK